MFNKINEIKNKMEEYSKSIFYYLIDNYKDKKFEDEKYDDYAEEIDNAINNGEILNIPELYREDAFNLAIEKIKQADRMEDVYIDENLINDTEQIIRMLSESLASEKAKKLGLVHIGFGNYAKEPGSPAIFKTVQGKLVKVKGYNKEKKSQSEKDDKKKDLSKEIEKQKDEAKRKKRGLSDITRVSGTKHTYEFLYDGRKYKMTLNKMELKQLKSGGSISSIIKNRMKQKEQRKKIKLLKKGKNVSNTGEN